MSLNDRTDDGIRLGPYICRGAINCGALMDRAIDDANAATGKSREEAIRFLEKIKAAHADWLEGHGLTGRNLRRAGTPFRAAYDDLEDWLAETAPSKPKRPQIRTGFVYVIGMEGDNSAVKIGFASKVEDRLSTLQTSSHQKLHILAVIRGTPKTEKELHCRFASQHIRGE